MNLPIKVKISSDILDYDMRIHWEGYMYRKYIENKKYIHFCDVEIEVITERNFLKKDIILGNTVYIWKSGPFWWGYSEESKNIICCWYRGQLVSSFLKNRINLRNINEKDN